MNIFYIKGNAFPVGGTHIDPVTDLPIPIELGSMFVDSVSQQPVPVMAITIDEVTGDAIAVGG